MKRCWEETTDTRRANAPCDGPWLQFRVKGQDETNGPVGTNDATRKHNHLSAVRCGNANSHAGQRVPTLLAVPRLRHAVETEVRRLLCVLLIRRCAVPTRAGRAGLPTKHLAHSAGVIAVTVLSVPAGCRVKFTFSPTFTFFSKRDGLALKVIVIAGQ